MTEEQDLTFSQLCRVHAAIGVPIVLGPDTLRRYAALMDEHEARCSEFVERGIALRDEARWWQRVSVVAAVTGVLVNLGLIWWLG
jgi:hypothetical protein